MWAALNTNLTHEDCLNRTVSIDLDNLAPSEAHPKYVSKEPVQVKNWIILYQNPAQAEKEPQTPNMQWKMFHKHQSQQQNSIHRTLI